MPDSPASAVFTNLTREIGIGANSYLLDFGSHRVLLDAGMHPKREGELATPLLHELDRFPVDGIFLTHAHLDHVGCIPLAMRRCPHAPVFMTETTAKIGSAMLHNSINVMSRQRDELGIREYPFFTHREADKLIARWESRPLRKPFNIAGERASRHDDISFELVESGHILGAAGVRIAHPGGNILYTSDVNFSDQTICRGARLPTEHVETLIVETTRGDATVPPDFTRASEAARLMAAIEDVFDNGGAVLIPVFALGKTQELLGLIYEMKRARRLRDCPVYLGGLSIKITEIIDRLRNDTPRLHHGLSLMDAVNPFPIDAGTIDTMPIRAGRLYTLSSGMMTENTLSHALAARFLQEPRHAVFFVGYTDPESPAGKIKAAAAAGRPAEVSEGRPPVDIRCRIESFDFSAHSSREDIMDYIATVQPARTILVHGDPTAMEWFRSAIAERLPETQAQIPAPGESIRL